MVFSLVDFVPRIQSEYDVRRVDEAAAEADILIRRNSASGMLNCAPISAVPKALLRHVKLGAWNLNVFHADLSRLAR